MKTLVFALTLGFLLQGCTSESPPDPGGSDYFDNTGREDVLSGGVRLIPIETPSGTFRVWTKRIGNHPSIKVLLLHGGPGATHEYLEAFDSYLPGAGIEYYYYDQLGSAYSDQPEDPELWEVQRFVDEVEQVRVALGLDAGNFYLYGQSWGGILAMEYALAHQENLKGLIISNMMASIPAYNEYAENVLMASMDPAVLSEIKALEAAEDYENPRYMELLVEHHYVDHILRLPPDEWPDPVNRAFAGINPDIYIPMQGPSELGASGKLLNWDRTVELSQIEVPTLVIGAEYDTMDPDHMEWMANTLPKGHYLYCANGSHMAMYDDQEIYFEGLIGFLREVDSTPPKSGLAPDSGTSAKSGPAPAEVGARIDSLFSVFALPGSPGAAAMVIRDGEVIHSKGYGLAELGSGRHLTRSTPFRLGSVGKPFTSMAIMILEERGELSFDDLATEFVPEIGRFPGIRVSHLLRHTSGLPDYYELPDETFLEVAAGGGDPLLTNADAISIYESWGEPVFEPGGQYEYSNPGYEVLALIVERASGETFGTFLAENLFGPLGMATAIVRDRPEVVIPGRAVGYGFDEDVGEWIENDDHFANWLVGAGGVYASLDDLFVWDQALYTETLVEGETLDEAFAPTVLNDGSISDYGFGWNVGDRIGRRAVHHGGGWVGFRTSIIRFLDERLTVIVLSNAAADAGGLADQVARFLLTP